MVRTVERENSNEGNDVDTVVMPFCGSFLFLYIFFFFLFFFIERRIINYYDFNFAACVC